MKNEKMLLYKKIMVTVVSGGMLLLPNWGYALPQGGQVVGGSGSIGSPGGGTMDITGNGGNLAIDWDSFNIAQGETVNFKNMQAVLNYVTGSQRSEIFGKLNGNGAHVFLLNPNGILFGAAAEVNVGSLTASTRSLPEEARKGFNGTLGNLDADGISKIQADIVNSGTIAADAINFEGNNISIIKADTLQIQGGDLGKVSLKAKNNINIGYEVTDKTTIDVGDGSGGHTVSDYSKGGGTKASSLGIVTAALDGSEKNITDCMLVHDVYELQAMNNNYETQKNSANFDYSYVNGDYMLANEIDASVTSSWNSGQGFACLGALKQLPMGTPSGFQGGFTGSLDGMGYTISDLTIERSGESYVGLFGCLTESARVTNLTLSGSISGQSSVGGIAGKNLGLIRNVANKAAVKGNSSVGGITSANYGTVEFVSNSGSITATNGGSVGGIASSNGDGNKTGIIKYAENTGAVIGWGNLGGIAGVNNSKGTIENAVNQGSVTSNVDDSTGFGGISGINKGTIKDVVNEGDVKIYKEGTMGGNSVGGISGNNIDKGTIENAVNKGAILGGVAVGGIVGENSGSIRNTENSGNIIGVISAAGGIVGRNANGKGSVIEAFNSGDVSGNGYIGGIVGNNKGGLIEAAANEGNISADQQLAGGIAGYNTNGGKIVNASNKGIITSGNSKGDSFAGGICGFNSGGSIANSYNTGDVTADGNYVGGVCGANANALVDGVYNTGAVEGADNVGGVAGYDGNDEELDYASIKNAYNTGSVSGNKNIGGILGLGEYGSVANVYNLGKVSGSADVDAIMGASDTEAVSAVRNAYFLTDSGYQKYGEGTVYATTAEFKQAFADGLGEEDKKVWQTDQKQTAPYLKPFLQEISGDVGRLEAAAGSDFKAALLAKLQELGINVDPDKILGLDGLAAGEYDLGELLYSTQDGYALQLTGTLVVKSGTQPEPKPEAPATDDKYTATLTSLQKKVVQAWEQSLVNDRDWHIEENRRIQLDNNSVKIEPVLFDEVNLQDEETPAE